VTAGLPTSFIVAATGPAPLSYQWLRNGNPLSPLATNSSWTISNVRLADADIAHFLPVRDHRHTVKGEGMPEFLAGWNSLCKRYST